MFTRRAQGAEPLTAGDRREGAAGGPSHGGGLREARAVVCYRCGGSLTVPVRAQSGSCPSCHRQLHVSDLVLRGAYWGAPVMTCGTVLIHRRGRIVTSRVVSSVGVTVHGRLEADVLTPGYVHIGPKGELVGSVRTGSLRIEPGGTLRGGPVGVARAAAVDGTRWTTPLSDVPAPVVTTGTIVTNPPDRLALGQTGPSVTQRAG